MNERFDLEQAIATWRHVHAQQRVFSREDLDELERHLRDHVNSQVEEGIEAHIAFQQALVLLGDIATGVLEYEKVRWGKLRKQRARWNELVYQSAMLRNVFKTALRSLNKRLGYTLVSGLSLTIGIACCLVIGSYIYQELQYDQHHQRSDRIYRVTNLDLTTGKQWAAIGPPVGLALANHSSDIEQVVRFIPLLEGAVLQRSKRHFREEHLMYADATIFSVFTASLVRGNPATALIEPNTIVLSERLARKYFGHDDPLGQVISLNGRLDLRVTGVMRNQPPTTHIPFEGLVSMSTFYARAGPWVDDAKTWSGFYTYILLREGSRIHTLAERIPAFINSFYEAKGAGPATDDRQLIFQPLASIHLHSQLEKELQANGNLLYVRLLGAVGLILLILAVINSVNMMTAQAVGRAREVGIRKSLGATSLGLVGHFLAEAFILVFAASGVAYAAAHATLSVFPQLFGDTLGGAFLFEPLTLVVIIGGSALLGLIAGFYPAFVLSRLQPMRVLKGWVRATQQGKRLRESLIVAQFVLATGLLVGMVVFYQQLQFLTQATLGFDRDQLIEVPVVPAAEQAVARHAQALTDALEQQATIEEVTLASGIPGERLPLNAFERVRRDVGPREVPEVQMRVVFGADHSYVTTLGLTVLHQRDVSTLALTDTSGGFFVNAAAVRELGLTPEQALGEVLKWKNAAYQGEIVGVLADFHFTSMHHAIEPLVIPLRPQFTNNHLIVRTNGLHASEALDDIEAVWNAILPDVVFSASFMDATFNAQYNAEQQMSRVVTFFAVVALFIACLGLLGLVSLMVVQRTREIGIRKVLGGTVASVVRLLVVDFLRFIILALVIAGPLAYFLMRQWLQGFAYSVELGAGAWLFTSVLVIGMALATISLRVIQAALADPVKSLRYE